MREHASLTKPKPSAPAPLPARARGPQGKQAAPGHVAPEPLAARAAPPAQATAGYDDLVDAVRVTKAKPSVQRQCDCASTSAGAAGGGLVQTKLAVGSPDDAHEREADAIADQIAGRGAAATAATRAAPDTVQRECAECPGEAGAKDVARPPGGAATSAGTAGVELPKGGGDALSASVRREMEGAFGHDFARVRVHTDARAAQLNRQLGAQAFTHGADIYFDRGTFDPASTQGKHLLAHELAHVVQQTGGGTAAIQRAPAEGAKARRDVVFITSSDVGAEARVLAPEGEVIRVKSLQEMAAKLRGINYPIRTLFVVSHALASGDLEFEVDAKKPVFVRPELIAGALQGTIAPENAPEAVDFRGCSIGSSPKAMADIRQALGAGAALGGTCFSVLQPQGPIRLDGKAITKPADVKDRAAFAAGMKLLVDSFGPAKGCILDRSEGAYFRAGGKMFAVWYNPEFDTKWSARKSKCRSALVPEVVDPNKPESAEAALERELAGDCKLIRVEK